jgi:hypothetical protein
MKNLKIMNRVTTSNVSLLRDLVYVWNLNRQTCPPSLGRSEVSGNATLIHGQIRDAERATLKEISSIYEKFFQLNSMRAQSNCPSLSLVKNKTWWTHDTLDEMAGEHVCMANGLSTGQLKMETHLKCVKLKGLSCIYDDFKLTVSKWVKLICKKVVGIIGMTEYWLIESSMRIAE